MKVWEQVSALLKKEFAVEMEREAIKHNCMATVLQVLHEKAKDDGDAKNFDVLSNAVDFLVKYGKIHSIPDYYFFNPKGMMRALLALNYKDGGFANYLRAMPFIFNNCCTVGPKDFDLYISYVVSKKVKNPLFEYLPLVVDDELLLMPFRSVTDETQAQIKAAYQSDGFVFMEPSDSFKSMLGLARSKFDETCFVREGHELNQVQGSCVNCALRCYCCCCFCPGYWALQHASNALRVKIKERCTVKLELRSRIFQQIILLAIGAKPEMAPANTDETPRMEDTPKIEG